MASYASSATSSWRASIHGRFRGRARDPRNDRVELPPGSRPPSSARSRPHRHDRASQEDEATLVGLLDYMAGLTGRSSSGAVHAERVFQKTAGAFDRPGRRQILAGCHPAPLRGPGESPPGPPLHPHRRHQRQGSVAAMCAAILEEAGLATALHVAPPVRYQERFRMNGADISDAELDPLLDRVLPLETTPPSSKFHRAGFCWFQQRKATWSSSKPPGRPPRRHQHCDAPGHRHHRHRHGPHAVPGNELTEIAREKPASSSRGFRS